MSAELRLDASWDHHNPPEILHDPSDPAGILHAAEIPGPAKLIVVEYRPGDNQGGFSDATAQLLISFGVGVASGVTANFLWEQLKNGHLRFLKVGAEEIRGPEFGGATDAEAIEKLTAILDQRIQEYMERRLEQDASDRTHPADGVLEQQPAPDPEV